MSDPTFTAEQLLKTVAKLRQKPSPFNDLAADQLEFAARLEEENARLRAALEAGPQAWRQVAYRVGEELGSVGPDNYYGLLPEQWRDWALSQVAALRGERGTE